jgi:hypothetical protein
MFTEPLSGPAFLPTNKDRAEKTLVPSSGAAGGENQRLAPRQMDTFRMRRNSGRRGFLIE